MGVPEINGKQYILAFTRRWRRLRWLELLCYALSFGFSVGVLCWLFTSDLLLSAIAFGMSGLLAAGFLYRYFKLNTLKPAATAQYLNRKVDKLEFSTELMLADRETLSLPARLQQRLVEQKLLQTTTLKPPVKLPDAGLFLLISILISVTLLYFSDLLPSAKHEQIQAEGSSFIHPADTTGIHTLREQLPSLRSGILQVSPPAYTGRKPFTTKLANLHVPENSRLTWKLQFDGTIEELWLSRPGKDSIDFQRTRDNSFTAQLDLTQTSLYQLVWKGNGQQTGTTDYLKLELIPDDGPQLQVLQPYQYVRSTQGNPFKVEAVATDEWGLTDAYLHMTFSRGSGEGVEFREEKVWFEQDFSDQPTEISLQMLLDPAALEMEPGDELYFYLQAFDNRQPRVQPSRTETYIFQWLDTARQASFEVDGMAMDLMPDYFRSQRQIIIDTETLIAEKGEISQEEFEKRAGNLGVDQKLLRLRYGKFLGEEFDAGYGPGDHDDREPGSDNEHGDHLHEPHDFHEEDPDHDHEDHDGQDHDDHHHEGQDREEDAEGSIPGDIHAGHEHDEQDPSQDTGTGAGGNMLIDFIHTHDTEEGATFYEDAVKVKLKAALAEMWEAELRLRTLRPKEALPYEYKALEIIKEVQQTTRIYVERVGFDPPPLRPDEKRLTGELEGVGSSSHLSSSTADDTLRAVKELIPALQHKSSKRNWRLSSAEAQLLKRAGDELALIVQEQPRGIYLRALGVLNEAMNSKEISPGQKQILLPALLELLPPKASALKKASYRTEMEKRFMQKIGGASE